MTDHLAAAQQAAERHLNDTWDRFHCEQDEGEDDTWDNWTGMAPFCGCGTCEVRETLHAAWPHLLEALHDGVLDLGDLYDAREGRHRVVQAIPADRIGPVSLNDSRHWAQENKVRRRLHDVVADYFRRHLADWQERHDDDTPVEFHLERHVPDRRRIDPDNLAAAGKAMLDGLVHLGYLPDDDASHVPAVTYRVVQASPLGDCWRVELQEVSA